MRAELWRMVERSLPVHGLCLLLPLMSGCSSLMRVQPEHFQFVTTVEKTEVGADGWREACIHANMLNMATHERFVCKVGIGMPIETEAVGPISNPLAQRIAADCANQAADIVIGSATASTTPGLACESFKRRFIKF